MSDVVTLDGTEIQHLDSVYASEIGSKEAFMLLTLNKGAGRVETFKIARGDFFKYLADNADLLVENISASALRKSNTRFDHTITYAGTLAKHKEFGQFYAYDDMYIIGIGFSLQTPCVGIPVSLVCKDLTHDTDVVYTSGEKPAPVHIYEGESFGYIPYGGTSAIPLSHNTAYGFRVAEVGDSVNGADLQLQLILQKA
jgi:hypothetical protein